MFWVGLAAVVVYVLIAAGLANLLAALVKPDSAIAEFVLTHYISLPILIAVGVIFARKAGWFADIWRDEQAIAEAPRRWWMLAVPVLLLVGPVLELFEVPWGERGFGLIALLAVGCLMIGFGEEFYYRGILRVSLRAHHGSFVALIVTAALFGISHSVDSLVNGVPLSIIAFQVAATGMTGALYYVAFCATGRLWVPIVIHALSDFVLYAQAGLESSGPHAEAPDPGVVAIAAQFVLGAFLIVFVVSALRSDARERTQRRASASAASVAD